MTSFLCECAYSLLSLLLNIFHSLALRNFLIRRKNFTFFNSRVTKKTLEKSKICDEISSNKRHPMSFDMPNQIVLVCGQRSFRLFLPTFLSYSSVKSTKSPPLIRSLVRSVSLFEQWQRMRKKHLLADEMGNLPIKRCPSISLDKWLSLSLSAVHAFCAREFKKQQEEKKIRYRLFNIQDVILIIHQVASSIVDVDEKV